MCVNDLDVNNKYAKWLYDNFLKVASRTVVKVLPDIHDNAFAFPCELKLLLNTIRIRERFSWGVPGNIWILHSLPLPYGCSIYLSEFPDIATRSFREGFWPGFWRIIRLASEKDLKERRENHFLLKQTTMIITFMQGKDTHKNDC